MYGKTLADFPERFEAFDLALRDMSLESIDAGFERCLRFGTEFPVPGEVLLAATSWHMEQQRKREDQSRKVKEAEWKQLAAGDDGEERDRLKAEFQQMLAEVKAKFPATTRQ